MLYVDVTDKQEVIMQSSSKGTQRKWFKDNVWYKADYNGYESLAETVCSQLAMCTNLPEYMSVVQYKPCTINICKQGQKLRTVQGCYSINFIDSTDSIITATRLLNINNVLDIKKSVVYNVGKYIDCVKQVTGLQQYADWLSMLMQFDALTLNEDRHFNNIIFIRTQTGFKYAPLFDNGASLLSAYRALYLPQLDTKTLIKQVEARPFSNSFAWQVRAVKQCSDVQLHLKTDKLNLKELQLSTMYPEWQLCRIQEVVNIQSKKYFGTKIEILFD